MQGRALASDRQEDDTRSQHPAAERPKVEKGKLFDLRWDKLVIAVGCYSQTFKTKGVKENAYFLKDVGDARKIRNRLLSCFEAAALPTTSVEMKKLLLNFAVVGGGPTGIEWSAELHDLINEDMKKLYPDLMKYVNITVYDVASKVLSMFDDRLSKFAMEHFNREGINIQPNHHVEELRQGLPGSINDQTGATHCYTLKLKEEGEIGIGMCVWSTGLMMNPYIKRALAGKLQRHPESRGILINDRLQATDEGGQAQGDVYAIGDCATVESATYPATAQVDSQQASWLAKRLNTGDIEQQVFTYKNLGVMAYVGNWNAILQSEGGDVSGRLAWIIWRSAYLVKSLSWRNRILIPVYWCVYYRDVLEEVLLTGCHRFINWVFGRDISRF